MGGGGTPQISSVPVPTPAPPVTSDSAEVIAAQQDEAQENLIKKSVKKTILAGDQVYTPGQPGGPGGPVASPTSYKAKLG